MIWAKQLSTLLSYCDESSLQLKDSVPCLCTSPHHQLLLVFLAAGLARFQSPEQEYATQLQQRSGRHRWLCRAQCDSMDASGPCPQFLASVPQRMRWGQLLSLPMPKGRMLWGCFHRPLFFQARWRLSRPEAAFQLHKPLALFGVMIPPLSRLCCSVGQLIPHCDWWKLPYWFLSLSKPQLCSTLVRHLKEYPLGSGAGREQSAVSCTGRPLPQIWGQANGEDWKASGGGQVGSLTSSKTLGRFKLSQHCWLTPKSLMK